MTTSTKIKIKVMLFTCAVVLFSANSSYAQLTDENKSRFGIKGGLNVSNLFTDDVDDENVKLGINAGLFLKIALTNHLAFQPELLYTMKGAKLKYNNDFVEGTGRFSLNYIEVPLLVVLNPVKNVNIHGGVYVATLTGVRIKNESDADQFDFEKELDKDNFENLDYGLVAGLGTDFNKVSFGIRYEYGLGKVGKEKTFLGNSYRFPDASNSTFQFYIGISIL